MGDDRARGRRCHFAHSAGVTHPASLRPGRHAADAGPAAPGRRSARGGDPRIILRDEIGHVAVGNRWYRWLREREGVDLVAHCAVLTERFGAPTLRPPFNRAARLAAGFTQQAIDALGTA